MRSRSIIGVVLCVGLAFSLLSGSGIGAAVFGESPDGDQTTRALEDIAGDADIEEDAEGGGGLAADIGGDNEPTLVGVALSGGQFAASLVGAVALLPVTLIQLGMPAYAAVPLGGMAQIVALIGLVQFVRGTEFL